MKNHDNTALLAHKRAFDKRRREAAIAKRKAANVSAVHKVAKAK